ncbi:type I restriction-modification enzyme 1%2C S subunit [Streptococcus pneumoniae]|nr:type I restriction-modification enzyme 1%2C S subunit [Streptococcus pneumoniae]CVM57145.1 type I restriction-modification enzyme 1%2C S subunit [Streptococcus pneumoniae]CVR17993.1 type I restriction-modification enzyme 1%2C S subunit [Streptococcus pneumoniae]CVR28866.1 type I restriction-modification enzyme 1%2C S subunit [Streptococcus pneumoniae]CVR41802.1 type I restriction-modification enzyme 1%2C S subunit [Streptococcus pneumoniae]
MFGDPLNNNKKFAVKTGQQCFKFSSGKFLDKHDRVFEGYPAYGGNGIAWKSRKYLIDNPTIIIGRVGAYCDLSTRATKSANSFWRARGGRIYF